MKVSTENAPPRPLAGARKRRPARELAVAYLFGPLADRVVLVLARLEIPPLAVVLANAVAGILAALALLQGTLVVAALLLQLKTLLDNADGQLARRSGRVTLVGRYLDTEADLVVNLVMFAALGSVTGEPWLALGAFCVLTLVLSVNFNAAELYREVTGDVAQTPSSSGGVAERALESVYRWVFAPQDRLVRAISRMRLERILRGVGDTEQREAALAYHDRLTVAVLANLGLSTQLVVLGACLVAGVPELYLWLVIGSAALPPLLQLRRERLARRVARGV